MEDEAMGAMKEVAEQFAAEHFKQGQFHILVRNLATESATLHP